MRYFKGENTINELNLSNRIYNALMRTNITTIGNLCRLTEHDLSSIKNMGKKSIDELLTVIKDITIVNELSDIQDQIDNRQIKTFIGNDGDVYKDIEINELQLSNRAVNCLTSSNLLYFSQIQKLSEDELLNIKNMGAKSVNEILQKIRTIKLEHVCIDNAQETDEQKVCRMIAKELSGDSIIIGIYDKLHEMLKTIQMGCDVDTIYEQLTDKLYENDDICECIKKFVFTGIEMKDNGISEISLFEQLPMCLKKRELFQNFLKKLIQEKLIQVNEDGLYEKRYPTAIEYAETIENARDSEILKMRLNGMTLEETGHKYSVTRERIRQIEAKYIKKSPHLMEDKYAYIFEHYDISKEDFLIGFREKEQTYHYLNIAYKHGKGNLNDMLDDEKLTNKEKRCAEHIIYKNYVMLNGERVLRSRSQLSEYVLRTVGKEGITFDEFKELYMMLLEDLGLQDNPKFTLMERGYENKMAASNHVLWKHHKRMRYYNLAAYDYSELYKKLKLEQYQNIEISTLKLFRENPDLMKEYDIQDEYELHNLLKKTCSEKLDIHFNRMPNIEFGRANRDKQVMDLLVEIAPVSNVDLAEAYEREYGVLSQTVLANYLKNFDKYFFDGKYKIDAPRMSELMLNELKKKLVHEFYLLSDIRRIYDKTFPNADAQMLNPFSIKELGFRVYTNYAVSNSYSSAVEYFRTILTRDDLVDATMFPDGLLTLIAYMAEVHRLKSCYEIVEYKPQKYINIRKLESVNCGIDIIKEYCKKVYTSTTPTFFTVYSLQKRGLTHEIDDLGFDEWFYSSLLAEDKKHFSYRRIGGNRLFRKGKNEVLLVDFLEWIIYSTDSLCMDIYDLADYLSNEFDINLNTFKIIETVTGSRLYYDRITEKLYAEYEVYFAEI